MTEPWVVDTNVGIVANDRPVDGDHPTESVLKCVLFLGNLMKIGRIAMDGDREIIREYPHKMRSTGEPGIGDAFLKWVLTNQANPSRCKIVDITNIAVPDQLKGFRDDEKFIRTALGCSEPQIAEAVDGLWWKRRADFEAVGITVNFLCPEEIKANSDSKYGPDALFDFS
jgi:hypothetical protein